MENMHTIPYTYQQPPKKGTKKQQTPNGKHYINDNSIILILFCTGVCQYTYEYPLIIP